jgi:hypothetical protein
MKKQHKWHKEIKAWADGAEIERYVESWDAWVVDYSPIWYVECQYRIKPQPQEPKYLYVYTTDNGIEFGTVGMAIKVNSLKDSFECIGKIKLEVENDTE